MPEIQQWRASTRSQGQGQCVEVGFGSGEVGIRDSKDRVAGHLAVHRRQWTAFLSRLKRWYGS